MEKKLSKIKIKRNKVEQELHSVSKEKYEEMNNKFNGPVDLDHLQDVKENPLLHIRKFESDTKLNALTNELEELKVDHFKICFFYYACDTLCVLLIVLLILRVFFFRTLKLIF